MCYAMVVNMEAIPLASLVRQTLPEKSSCDVVSVRTVNGMDRVLEERRQEGDTCVLVVIMGSKYYRNTVLKSLTPRKDQFGLRRKQIRYVPAEKYATKERARATANRIGARIMRLT